MGIFYYGPWNGSLVGGGSGGGGPASTAGTFIMSRSGKTTVGGGFRIPTTNIPMTYGGRGYIAYNRFKLQKFNYWGNTDDLTSIGIELRHVRIINGVDITIKNQILNYPSVAAGTLEGLRVVLPEPFEITVGDYIYARVLAASDGGTAGDVSNPVLIFEVEK